MRDVAVGLVVLSLAALAACGSNPGGASKHVSTPPTLSYAGAAGTTIVVGTPMKVSPTTLAFNGDPITGCGIKPGSANASSFPATLGINSTTCVISGTPTAPLPATSFTIVATNAAGTSADSGVTLTVHAGWLQQLGATSATSAAQGVAVDTTGNSYVAGYTTGGLSGNTQTGTEDLFIAKHGVAGTLAWLKQLGATGQSTRASSVAVDASGNSYVAGFTSGGLSGNTATGKEDFFLAKYDASGTLTWLKQLGVASLQSWAYGVSVDASGGIYVAGSTTGGLAGNAQTGTEDYFVAKYDPSGALAWLKQNGAASQVTRASSIAADASGDICVAGLITSGAGYPGYFIAKYDASGARNWIQQHSVTSGDARAQGVAVDSSGNCYVAGLTTVALLPNTQTGSEDYYVAQYSASGTLTWRKQLGVKTKLSRAYAVGVDASGNSYVAGLTNGGLANNPQTGSLDYFVAQYDASGTQIWLKQVGATGASSSANAIAVDASGNSYVAGYTTGGLAGNSPTGKYDYFIANYSFAGNF